MPHRHKSARLIYRGAYAVTATITCYSEVALNLVYLLRPESLYLQCLSWFPNAVRAHLS